MEPIRDQYGRTFRTLRVSLLSQCNFGCVYCVAGENELREVNNAGRQEMLPTARLLEMIGRLHEQLVLETIRLTGGEPLLYPGLTTLVAGIHALGIEKIKLTTNGALLDRKAAELTKAGLRSVNVSLDAVEEGAFARMSRRNALERVVAGIDAALAAGLTVKLNAVIMKGINEDQILPLLDFARQRGITVRFLEVMAMGHLFHHSAPYLFAQREILGVIGEHYALNALERKPSSTARYWETDAGHRFGIIANESEPFCGDCDRLRLDSGGNIYGCLSSNHPIALDPKDDTGQLTEKLRQALGQKQAVKFTGSELSMLKIGG
ncbi:MAG TPA: radical SAM protein [Puia sp.]|nr:radical SAM protein [Puia sp.]